MCQDCSRFVTTPGLLFAGISIIKYDVDLSASWRGLPAGPNGLATTPSNFQQSTTLPERVVPLGTCCESMKSMTIGVTKFFNETKGYGFISPEDGSKDVFVHISAVEQSGLSTLREGQKVEFEVQPDQRGPKAVNLRAVD